MLALLLAGLLSVILTAFSADPLGFCYACPVRTVPFSREVGPHAHREIAVDLPLVELDGRGDGEDRQDGEKKEHQLSTDERHGVVNGDVLLFDGDVDVDSGG